ncbi:hypothetical protein GHT09_003997 [Marmota monax]|uniref:G-protein coupled receptors family 1 profile domain-containing protein n=1 Tax=Marmota monax TaxID=9995 RepID=A0A834PS05_MARMO|nr:hypothetical protein GHT09_003997 [Marmota monax]
MLLSYSSLIQPQSKPKWSFLGQKERIRDSRLRELVCPSEAEDPDLQPLLFGLFLLMYLVTVLGNLLIILAISSNPHLHAPMYFSNLSFVDICFTSTTVPKMLVSSCDTHINNIILIILYVTTALLGVFPVTGILYSYSQIVSSLMRMSSNGSKYKAFFTCGSHLCVVSLYYGTSLVEYLSFILTQSSQGSTIASVMCTVVTPMLNPFIYSLRNKDVKGALGRLLSRAASCH